MIFSEVEELGLGSWGWFSQDGEHCYGLYFRWSEGHLASFFLSRPTTSPWVLEAKALSVCRDSAKGAGYGGLLVGFLFSTRVMPLERAVAGGAFASAVNEAWLDVPLRVATAAVACWGMQGFGTWESGVVMGKLSGMPWYALKEGRVGQPVAPIFLVADEYPLTPYCVGEGVSWQGPVPPRAALDACEPPVLRALPAVF